MGKNGRQKNGENGKKEKKDKEDLLSHGAQKWIKAIVMFLAAIVIGLSFFGKAGVAGHWIDAIAKFLAGDSKLTVATIVLALVMGGFVFLKSHKKIKVVVMALAVGALIIGVSGIASNQNLNEQKGGLIGLAAQGITSLFGLLVSNIIFGAILLVSVVMFVEAVWPEKKEGEEKEKKKIPEVPPLKISGVNNERSAPEKMAPKISLFKNDERPKKVLAVPIIAKLSKGKYSLPPVDLLGKDETAPTSGNIKENSLIIKKTLENFGINVGMSEVNVGPTVTQYAFKPAEGVKLSKITTLSNNLALHWPPIQFELKRPFPVSRS
jgi:S-DNA-T family DNA segregation ATPase FtsK/SpoIIIE